MQGAGPAEEGDDGAGGECCGGIPQGGAQPDGGHHTAHHQADRAIDFFLSKIDFDRKSILIGNQF